MKQVLHLLLISVVTVFYANSYGQSIHTGNLEVRINALIPEQVTDATPGVVIGVVKQGELIFSNGYGLGNMSYNMPNDPKMVYNIGSVSKQFLGYAFAMLHVDGKIDIDDSAGKYLEDWPVFEKPVSIRNLLTHTSGYREAYTISNLAGRFIGIDRLSREECLEVVRNQPELEFEPGARHTYNSTAWVILAEIFEKVTGVPADEWITTNILQPLQMKDTQIESYVGDVIQNAAESYSYNSEKGYTNEKSNRAIFGAADVYTNINDLKNWLNNYRTMAIGGKDVNKLFLNPFVFNDGVNSEYALGIGVGEYRGLKRYRHTGGHEAFSTQLSYYPEHDIGIIVISNFGRRGSVSSSKIAELLMEDFMSSSETYDDEVIKIEKNKLEQLAGLYVSSKFNQVVNLKLEEESLVYNGNSKLIPVHENMFRINGWDGKMQIKKGVDNQIHMISFNGNSTDRFIRTESWKPKAAELKSFEGEYWSDEIEALYHLSVTKGNLTITHRWLGEILLEPVSKDFFKSNWGLFVKYKRNNNHEITGFSVYSGRTLNVFFERK